MKTPDKIYIGRQNIPNMLGGIWSGKPAKETDIPFIRKDLLLEWAKERYQSTISNVGCYTGHSVWQEVIDKLNNF